MSYPLLLSLSIIIVWANIILCWYTLYWYIFHDEKDLLWKFCLILWDEKCIYKWYSLQWCNCYLFIYLLACKLSNGLIKLAFHNSNNTKSTVPELSNFQNIFFSFYYDWMDIIWNWLFVHTIILCKVPWSLIKKSVIGIVF